mmetsp:Transcript_3675/g.11349  ORF Transcript_3675/g.11349 Transcript_3675/m.11349 type:complete len:248 (-) Transcript_3675:2755-3498(-)
MVMSSGGADAVVLRESGTVAAVFPPREPSRVCISQWSLRTANRSSSRAITSERQSTQSKWDNFSRPAARELSPTVEIAPIVLAPPQPARPPSASRTLLEGSAASFSDSAADGCASTAGGSSGMAKSADPLALPGGWTSVGGVGMGGGIGAGRPSVLDSMAAGMPASSLRVVERWRLSDSTSRPHAAGALAVSRALLLDMGVCWDGCSNPLTRSELHSERVAEEALPRPPCEAGSVDAGSEVGSEAPA